MSKPALLLIGEITPRMRERIETEFEVIPLPRTETDTLADDTAGKITAAITFGGAGLTPELMDRLPNLKIVSNYGVGYDGIDMARAVERGVLVSHTPDVLNDEVANPAILLWLATARKLPAYDTYVRAGRWERDGNPPLTRGTQGRTVGILGLGRIGLAIADRLPPFGATIVYHSRTRKDVPYEYFDNLTDMARACDVLICITPGGAETHHIVNAEVIEALGPDGILVNVARGPVVDETALIEALEHKRLGGAGLDVFENEPRVPTALRAMDNVTLQPHVGSATVETRAAMGDLTCDNLSQWLKDGTVLTPVPECVDMQ